MELTTSWSSESSGGKKGGKRDRGKEWERRRGDGREKENERRKEGRGDSET